MCPFHIIVYAKYLIVFYIELIHIWYDINMTLICAVITIFQKDLLSYVPFQDTCTIFGMSAKMDYFHRSSGSPFYCFFAIMEEDIATNR